MLPISVATSFFFVFGILAVVGGVLGFVKAKSRASLIAGGISGVLLCVAAYVTTTANARIGLVAALVLSLALAGRFVPGFLKSRKVMPAGLMAALSVAGIGIAALALM